PQNLAQYNFNIIGCPVTLSSTVKDLGVILDCNLSFEKHISYVTKTAFFHLRNIAKLRNMLSVSDAEKLVHAFMTSRLDYCNALLAGCPASSINKLQLVQNAAARVLTRSRKYDHITPILSSLHWLPIKFRINYKVLLLTYSPKRLSSSLFNVKDLGVILDCNLSFEKHISYVTKTAFFHLRNIAKLRNMLSVSDAEKLVHAFMTSRLDYCNALLAGCPASSINKLQLVQNAAARVLTRSRKYDHITPILSSLHWLPIKFRINYKVLLLTYSPKRLSSSLFNGSSIAL
ncbi:hypothetical protein PO909_013398, partial [Leuciscus waleckii]